MPNTGIQFVNKVADNDSLNILNYRNFYNGGGVASGDINNDGLPDLFFTANQGANKLYLNKGGFQFEDISEKAGFKDKLQYSTGVVFVDINNDGWLDIYVSNAGSLNNAALRKNQLYINNHDLTFTESAHSYGLDDDGYTTQATFFDYDLDGDLDCFLINNSPIPVNSLGYPKQREVLAKDWPVPANVKGGGDHLYRNENGHFVEVTKAAGIHGTLMSFGLGITVADINGDHYPDIYVSNDFFERDYIYINQRNGTFKDQLDQMLSHTSFASMGADIGDINNDGNPDIFTTDMLPADDYRLKTTLSFDDIDQYRLKERNDFHHQFLQNTLQLNTGQNKFIDIANYSGVNASEWSWGALMFDADNDGYNDLYICNGIYRDLTNQDFLDFDANEIKEKMIRTGEKSLTELVTRIPSIAVPNKMFRNKGNLQFEDIGIDWGFNQNSFSNGATYVDIDNDGDLDLVVNNVNEPAMIFQNHAAENKSNHYIGFTFKGIDNNIFAIGTKVELYFGESKISRELFPCRGFQSSMDYKVLVGLGAKKQPDSVVVYWPNNTAEKLTNYQIDKVNSVQQPQFDKKAINKLNIEETKPFFIQENIDFDKHQQPDYTDFYAERGVPIMLSHNGPHAAVGDVNGDGIEDVFVSGTSLQIGQLYIQNPKGGFSKKEIKGLQQFNSFEDGAVAFIDVDGDKDLDLLITAAGNNAIPGSREMQHRLFINNGKGDFEINTNAFPANQDNIACIVSDDFDKDGDIDLFIGAESVSREYGLRPSSHVYMNNGKGKFEDLSASKMGSLQKVGMLSDAVLCDIDGDGSKDLVLVGAWMAPKVFSFKNGGFTALETNLKQLNGWWSCIKAVDVNNDGKEDLVIGNIGENFNLKANAISPLKMYTADFDDNGSIDKIMTKTIDGKDKPVFMKRDVQDQIPSTKKKALKHQDFATKSIQELLNADKIKNAQVDFINYTSSIIAINKGNGQFEIQTLPFMAQLSSIHSILPIDVNKDGAIDLLVSGNDFYFQPQLGRLDANQGLLLMNNGKGLFNALKDMSTGLRLDGMVRDQKIIPSKEGSKVLILQNDKTPMLFKLSH